MSHYWAEQYARQRFQELSGEARGDQLLGTVDLPAPQPRTGPAGWPLSRLRATLAALARRRVNPATGAR